MSTKHVCQMSLPPLFFFAVLLLCSCNDRTQNPRDGSTTPGAKGNSTMDIIEAAAAGKLRFNLSSDSSSTVTLEINVISSQPLEVKFRPDYIAKCTEFGLCNDRVLIESTIYSLKPGEQVEKKIRTYRTSRLYKPPTGRKTEFRLETLSSHDPLTKFVDFLIKNPDSDEKIAEIAVWAAAEKMSFGDLHRLRDPLVTGKDYQASMELLHKADIRTDNLQMNIDAANALLNYTEQLAKTDRTAVLGAIEFLGWFYKIPEAAKPVIEVMEENEDHVIREKAASVLGASGLEAAREPLILTLELDAVRSVRRAAAFSLIELGDLSAVPLAIMFLGDEKAQESAVARASAKLSELTEAGSDDWKAKEWEVWWLTESGWKWLEARGAHVERVKEVMNAQHRFSRDPSAEAASAMEAEDADLVLAWLRKLHANDGRKKLEDDEVFEKVLSAGRETKNAAVALNVVWILRNSKQPARIEKGKGILLEMLSKKETRAAYKDIISVLAEWKVAQAVEPLIYLLDDKQYGKYAAEALRDITGKRISSDEREEWRSVLSQHGGKIKSEFVKRLKEAESDELTQALSDLGSNRYRKLWSDREINEALLNAWERISEWEQVNAYALILTSGEKDPRVQHTFIKIINHAEDFRIKKTLIETLAREFPNGITVELMLGLLDNPDRRAKLAAREALYEVTRATSPVRLRTKGDWLEYFSKNPAARWGRRQK